MGALQEESGVLLDRRKTIRALAELEEKLEHMRLYTASRGPLF